MNERSNRSHPRRPVAGSWLVALGLALALGACTSTPERVVIPAQKATLADLVDKRVEFTGEAGGPSPQGDYIITTGIFVHLDKLSLADRYGQRVTVTGRLRRFQPPDPAKCGKDCKNAGVPPHYWIEDGKIVTPTPPAQ